MTRIGYEIQIVVDKIETNWIDSSIIVKDDLACDFNGNPVEGYSKRTTKLPVVTITHNNESITLAEFNTRWLKFAREESELPFKESHIGISDNTLTFSEDAYTKNQFDYICEQIVKFMKRIFYVTIDLNEIQRF